MCDTLHAIVYQREIHWRYLQSGHVHAHALERKSEKKVQSVDLHRVIRVPHGSRLDTTALPSADLSRIFFSTECYNQTMNILQ